jgi:hypothetical protein
MTDEGDFKKAISAHLGRAFEEAAGDRAVVGFLRGYEEKDAVLLLAHAFNDRIAEFVSAMEGEVIYRNGADLMDAVDGLSNLT